jgi:acyl-CoA synthetase (AMP-forming)/AMP-acid ligase II
MSLTATLPEIAADTGTVWALWQRHAAERPHAEAVVHWVAGEEPFRWRWGPLWERALSYAAALREAGVRPGEVCATIVRHHPELYPLYMGIALAGGIPAVLAYPNARLHPQKFRDGLEGMSRHSGIDWLLTERSLGEVVQPLVGKEGSTVRGIVFPLEWELLPADEGAVCAEADPDAPCLLQHSSGTTGLQKGVVLSHRTVREHLRLYGDAIRVSDDDRVVSWLPLYHDMGLIAALHLPLAVGIPTVQLDPFEWVLSPVLLLQAISREGGTLGFFPNFAFNMLADRVLDEDLEGVRLDSLRLLVSGGEAVRAESHARFVRRYAPLGLRPEVPSAMYGMAEITFSATQVPPGAPPPEVTASRAELVRGRFVPAREGESSRTCVSSGVPLEGVVLRVVDPETRRELPDGEVGEFSIRSPTLFDGYRNNPEKTAEVVRGGWYWSGDLGFVLDGHTYVIGRLKDVIIVAGNNLYPEDVEDAVSAVPGILPGRVVAFGVDDDDAGTERVCVVAETAVTGAGERKALKLAVLEAAARTDVTLSRVYLAEPRWLIKSSSGKPSRSANRERALSELAPA